MNQEMAIRLRNGRIAVHPGLDGLPPRWRPELVRRAVSACKHFTMPRIVDFYINKEIEDFRREHALRGLDLSASDPEVVDTARRRADNMARIFAGGMEEWAAEDIIANTCKCANVPHPKGATLEIRIRRISCMHWWRRQLRRVHARAIENGNIKLQFVQAKCEPYASRDAVRRCSSQDERNRLWMESTIMQNEIGDQFTMQALAERSTSNKAIRRSELMTRMRGIEEVASERGDVGLFVTITCPSYFHATLRQSGKPNPQYRGRTPRQAQDYLCKVWGRVRAKLKREGVHVYGLRVAEPHHDACPHWHLIVFTTPAHAQLVKNAIAHHALLDSPDESGAQKNRCNFKEIDAEKGSATAYIAKYISKNIDGHGMDVDLDGAPASDTSKRVTAWSKTHGIRQFQAFGAGSVMVWRELRRIPQAVIADAPGHILAAWQATNKTTTTDGEIDQRASYANFLRAVGGAAVLRTEATIKLAMLYRDAPNKYGEPQGEKPIGVYASAEPLKIYESTRYNWVRVESMRSTVRMVAARARALPAGFGSTWTRVNNCTRHMPNAFKTCAEGGVTTSKFERIRC